MIFCYESALEFVPSIKKNLKKQGSSASQPLLVEVVRS
jgi:hypothetical protein